MKTTPFHPIHQKLNAKMAAFAGYEMPIQYSSITEEHLAVREKAGLFDVSHMGSFIIRGPQSDEYIQFLTSNNIEKLSPGKVQYSCLLKPNGGILDDLLVYKLQENCFMLVVNASNRAKNWDWIVKHKPQFSEIEIIDISDRTALLALQGPKAISIIQKLTKLPVSEFSNYSFQKGIVAGVENVLVSTTGYTGAGGVEIYFDNKHAEKLWNALMLEGKDNGLLPAGLGARDTLRLEKGYCLYGNDITEETNPFEAGLGWITKAIDSNIARNSLSQIKATGNPKRLLGFILSEKGIPRSGYQVLNEEKEIIGEVTSGGISPILQKGIGMAYLPKEYRKTDRTIFIQIRKKQVKAQIHDLPFV